MRNKFDALRGNYKTNDELRYELISHLLYIYDIDQDGQRLVRIIEVCRLIQTFFVDFLFFFYLLIINWTYVSYDLNCFDDDLQIWWLVTRSLEHNLFWRSKESLNYLISIGNYNLQGLKSWCLNIWFETTRTTYNYSCINVNTILTSFLDVVLSNMRQRKERSGQRLKI